MNQIPSLNGLVINETTLPVIKLLAENMPGGFFIYHADDAEELIYYNSRMLDIFGCEDDGQFIELTHNTFKGIVHPYDLDEVEKTITEQISSNPEKLDHVVYRIIRRDGSIHWVQDWGHFSHSDEYGDCYYVFIQEDDERVYAGQLHAMISELSENYEILANVDFESEEIELIKVSDKIPRLKTDRFTKNDFRKKIKEFAHRFVIPEMYGQFLDSMNLLRIKEILDKGRQYSGRFKMKFGPRAEWYELKFAYPAQDQSGRTAIAGICNINNEVIRELQRQAELRRAEYKEQEHLTAFHDIIHSGMWSIRVSADCEIERVMWSDEFRKLLGYHDEFDFPNTLETLVNLIHPDDRDVCMDLFWDGLRDRSGEIIFDIDYRARHRNGEYRWYHAAAKNESNFDGTYQYFGIFIDTTVEHMNAELQAEQQKNLDIIDILASECLSVCYVDLETGFLEPYSMSEGFETGLGRIFREGISYSRAFRQFVKFLVHDDDKKMVLSAGSAKNIKKELSSKKSFQTMYRTVFGRYCEMKFVKVGENADPKAVALAFIDRDEEIREKMAREEQDIRDRSVISGLADDFTCVIYVDMNTNREFCYRLDPFFNGRIPGWSDMTDFSARICAMTDTVVHPDDRGDFAEKTALPVIRSQLEKEGVYFVNFRLLVDDRIQYYQIKFVMDENDASHFTAGFHNVDEAMKREMSALERAEIANRAKTAFLFNMSHDIRTPMNVITGYTAMAKSYLDDKDRLRSYLDKIDTANDVLLSLINQVLEMARIESGKVVLQRKHGDIREHSDICNSLFGGQAGQKGIAFRTELVNVSHPRVITDTDRFGQILTNIIGNAMKFTPEGGSVTYKAEEFPLPQDGWSEYCFTVADTGIGMSPEFQKHIFDEFAREQTSTVSRIQGTGLGMSIVRQLVDLMNGKIFIESEKGVGTTIKVTIPMEHDTYVAEEPADGTETPAVSIEGMKLLLVDDNEMNREIGAEILTLKGACVTEAEDGDVAVEMLRNAQAGEYDLVLMDIQMPRMSGYEATKAIRSLPDQRIARIPIFAMTANAFEEDRQDAVEAGMDGHIAKPVDVASLIKVLSEYRNR